MLLAAQGVGSPASQVANAALASQPSTVSGQVIDASQLGVDRNSSWSLSKSQPNSTYCPLPLVTKGKGVMAGVVGQTKKDKERAYKNGARVPQLVQGWLCAVLARLSLCLHPCCAVLCRAVMRCMQFWACGRALKRQMPRMQQQQQMGPAAMSMGRSSRGPQQQSGGPARQHQRLRRGRLHAWLTDSTRDWLAAHKPAAHCPNLCFVRSHISLGCRQALRALMTGAVCRQPGGL